MKRSLSFGAFAASLLLVSTSVAEVLQFKATLSPANEVPAVNSTASGLVNLSFDTSNKSYTAYITATGLSSSITMSHIHEGAAGANGPVVNNFGGASSYITASGGFASGKFTGTYSGDVAKLLSEGAYVNIHTTNFGGGEIRGQLVRHQAKEGRLFNVSALGRVDNLPLIVGFTLHNEQRVMVRSLGSSLGGLGVSGAIANTQLMLFNSSGAVIAQNDDWKTGQALAVGTSGNVPIADSDAGLIRYLPAGRYTAMVPTQRGPGMALLDAFAIEEDSLATGLTKANTFSTLLTAVQSAGLLDVVVGPGPFTLFAPTDAAFAKLPAGTVSNLLLPENRSTLVGILLYHIVPAKVLSTQLTDGMQASTLQGGKLTIDLDAGVKINSSNVTEADWVVSNGVIHVIDTVLLPPSS